jgi:hypothetical protein
MYGERLSYTRYDVVTLGFEALCTREDGTRYLWHDDCGLRVDPQASSTTMITDSGLLPDGPWLPTRLGERELLEGVVWR